MTLDWIVLITGLCSMKQWYFKKKLNADSLTAKGFCSQNVHYVKEVVVLRNWLFQEVKFDYNSIKMSLSLLICTLYIHVQAIILLNTNIKKNIYLPATNAWTLKYTLGDKLQQHVAATRRSDKSLRVCWRIVVKIFVSAT